MSTLQEQASYRWIHADDTVLVAIRPLSAGETMTVEGRSLRIREDIPRGHKIALTSIQPGEDVIKYGFPIGRASQAIKRGEWVHTHNVKTGLEGTQTYQYRPEKTKIDPRTTAKTFQGYVREDGEVGIRNEIWIINTVGCINKTAEVLAKMAGDRYENLDGVYHYPHPFGCSQLGDDLEKTQRILANLVQHPNAAGVLVIGLGCENNDVASFKQVLGDVNEDRVKFLISQDVEDELEAGLEQLDALAEYAGRFQKKEIPLSRLKVGLKCGGSDGFSGITANPLVGAFSDLLIAHGGTTILTEVPEMFGAETILMNRAEDKRVFEETVQLINGFKEYFIKHDQPVYENPSPGNKDGGITTLEEKSLGCVQKGGFADVVDVLPYGGSVEKPGLNLVQGPGNDLVSVTTLAAAGAHIVIFTTGRGTPFGGPVPTVKMSTNTELYHRKKNWIDFNAGELLEGKGMDELKESLLHYMAALASGETRTHNERNGFKEIALFKDGVIL